VSADKIMVQEIMTKDVLTIKPGEDVEKAARLLLERGVSGMPVVDDEGKVVGILSEGDLVSREKTVRPPVFGEILGAVFYLESPQKFFDELKRTVSREVKELMTARVYTARPENTLQEVSTLMVEKNINRVPVVDEEGRLLGILTRQDILRALHREEEKKKGS